MNKKILGIIPARGGSKGIPGKNLRLLAGKPLLEYTVDAAISSGVVDRLVLSTDSPEIARLGEKLGAEVPCLRPAELAEDDTPMLPVLVHMVSFLETHGFSPDIIVLLQPTAPMRRPEHISRAVKLLLSVGSDSVVSVVELPRHSSPDYVMKIDNGRLANFLPEGARITRRQDVRPAYIRDGTVYVVMRDVLMKTCSLYGQNCCPLVLPQSESITLDTLDDWNKAEHILGSSTLS